MLLRSGLHAARRGGVGECVEGEREGVGGDVDMEQGSPRRKGVEECVASQHETAKRRRSCTSVALRERP